MRNWNIPNIITVIRLIIAIVFVPVYFWESGNGLGYFGVERGVSLALYVFASVTDVLDGYIARKYSLITEFGKIFDPIADKLLQFLVAAGIAFFDPFFIWVAAFIFVKECVMAVGTRKLYKKKIGVSANVFGKIASVIYFVMFFIIIGFKDSVSDNVKYIIVAVFLVSASAAFVNYFIQYFKNIEKVEKIEKIEKKEPENQKN
jgi:cardiolipin synthase